MSKNAPTIVVQTNKIVEQDQPPTGPNMSHPVAATQQWYYLCGWSAGEAGRNICHVPSTSGAGQT